MFHKNKKITDNLAAILWAVVGVLLLAMLFARALFSEYLWLTVVIAVFLVVALAALINQNRKALRSRTAAFGVNAIVTVILVVSIVGVLNFIVSRYPQKIDLTRNKMHTLSEQTVKIIKGLQKPVRAVMFAKAMQREQTRPLLDNLKGLNTKFEVEFVDPDKEPARAKQAGIKKYGTLQLIFGTRESKVDEINEEKVTNALIKLLKDKAQTICAITGHGEKSFAGNDAEGYLAVKSELASQSYEIKDVSLMQEGKIPDNCDAIVIIGPNKAFFEPEIKTLSSYFENGGRAIVAVDVNIKGQEFSPEINNLLQAWYIRPMMALIVDPLSKMLGVDAAVPVVASYSKDNPITKEFQATCYFPFARPLEIMAGAPATMNVQWLAQTTPKSWAEADFKEVTSGQVKFDQGKDKQGPLSIAVAVDGKVKDSKATKKTRLVVFGTSQFASNNYSRFGGNIDFLLNAINWVLDDESFISIRAKEDGANKVELTQKQGTFIFLLTVILIPLFIAIGGIVIWILRKKL